jgi:hypothetical protein
VQTFPVVTVVPTLPLPVLDLVLTSIERTLNDAGALRIWVDSEGPTPGMTVMAEFPADAWG